MTAVCRCGHPHQPGMTHCYVCELPLNVPPASAPPPRARGGAASPPMAPARRGDPGPPLSGEDFRKAMRQALTDRAKAKRNQRGRRPAPQPTGYVVKPPPRSP